MLAVKLGFLVEITVHDDPHSFEQNRDVYVTQRELCIINVNRIRYK